MQHAKARAASSLENGDGAEYGLVLSDDEDEDEGNEAVPKVYKWSPDDVLCHNCFLSEFEGAYYAWWLEERQTDRVPGKSS